MLNLSIILNELILSLVIGKLLIHKLTVTEVFILTFSYFLIRESDIMNMFPTKKSEVISNLIKFCETELLCYSSKRNFDLGIPHKNVSKLSPYLSTRFVNEVEVLKIAVSKTNVESIEKFIDEIFWKTYWKGWLETHPWVYDEYIKSNRVQKVPSKTGIKCFDYWKDELLNTGYLHNHSRMWFASIWIFTLGYDWQSGADFFARNLIDFCPASNTLGWRWVAGLQTLNKPYLASSDNISYFTKYRFNPKGQLNEKVISKYQNHHNNKIVKFKQPERLQLKNSDELGIILNKNDLSINEIFDKQELTYHCCLFSTDHENKLIREFQTKIDEDILNRNKNFCLTKNYQEIFCWLIEKKIKNLILPYETVGNKILNNHQFKNKLKKLDINYVFYLRDWDRNAFPHATKGFFKFKKNIPVLMNLAKI